MAVVTMTIAQTGTAVFTKEYESDEQAKTQHKEISDTLNGHRPQ